MSNKHNYTNYSKANKPAKETLETTVPGSQADENTQNIQETEPTTNAIPETQTTQPEPESQTPANAEQEPKASKTAIGVVVNCEKLNIRAEAKTDAKILGTFFKGQEVEIYLDTSTDAFYDVNVGFCMKKYIKLNK